MILAVFWIDPLKQSETKVVKQMMKSYNNLKVRTKILLGFCIVTIIMLLMVAYTLIGLRGIIGSYENLIEGHYHRRDTRYDYKHSFEAIQGHTNAMLAYGSIGDTVSVEASASRAHDAYMDALASLEAYNQLVRTDNDIPSHEKDLRWATSGQVADILGDYYRTVVLSVKQHAMNGDVAAGLQAVHNGQAISTHLAEANAFLNNISDVWFAGIDENNNRTEALTYTIIVIALSIIILLSIIITIVTAHSINISITYPAQAMAGFLRQIHETGSLVFPESKWQDAEKMSRGKDDISKALAAFLDMLKRFTYYGQCMEIISARDLSGEIKVVSGEDTCGVALVNMQGTLSSVFKNLNAVSSQVATGARKIASGSQGLAQGSTEQAATVEELSATIAEIADKTRENSDMASRSAGLAASITQSAENGSRHMADMIKAVNEINEAGQNISKVIKAIDEIAFQTNILALNAAVEAARAGQHGKGFAVVADEVRSLAAKSAEAAKDTSALITTSIEKSEMGARIAQETAASLEEIVAGISENSQIAASIAESSKNQTVSISQVNESIDQVAQVAQQNSTTAEESAATSQELSGQSDMLDQLIAQFKFKK